jgi:ribosomal protein L40E
MWRRRRDRAQADFGHPARRPRRAWRLDRRGSARVAWGVTPDLARHGAPAGLVPAGAAGGARAAEARDWRLGAEMPSVMCTACGAANPEDARFCSQCGSPLVRAAGERSADTTSVISVIGQEVVETDADDSVADAATLDALPAGTALLVVRRGPNAGSRFLLDHDLTLVGRHPDSDIFLDDVTVSRRHAEFYREGGAFTVRDVGSLNGTYVNRERIEETALTGGEEVQIGKFRLVFLLSPRAYAEHGAGA